eukprot:799235-Prorocentrum_minimum.AAC.1
MELSSGRGLNVHVEPYITPPVCGDPGQCRNCRSRNGTPPAARAPRMWGCSTARRKIARSAPTSQSISQSVSQPKSHCTTRTATCARKQVRATSVWRM